MIKNRGKNSTFFLHFQILSPYLQCETVYHLMIPE
nr:MAG TPA: hypothetical protein [Caudoviricetes sp.]